MTNQDGTNSESAEVKITNLRTGEAVTGTTNSIGEYVIDLANMQQEYQNGDMLYVMAESGSNYSLCFYATVNTATGFSEQDIVIYYVINRQKESDLRDIPIFTYEPLAMGTRTVPMLITSDGKFLPLKGVDDGTGLAKAEAVAE